MFSYKIQVQSYFQDHPDIRSKAAISRVSKICALLDLSVLGIITCLFLCWHDIWGDATHMAAGSACQRRRLSQQSSSSLPRRCGTCMRPAMAPLSCMMCARTAEAPVALSCFRSSRCQHRQARSSPMVRCTAATLGVKTHRTPGAAGNVGNPRFTMLRCPTQTHAHKFSHTHEYAHTMTMHAAHCTKLTTLKVRTLPAFTTHPASRGRA